MPQSSYCKVEISWDQVTYLINKVSYRKEWCIRSNDSVRDQDSKTGVLGLFVFNIPDFLLRKLLFWEANVVEKNITQRGGQAWCPIPVAPVIHCCPGKVRWCLQTSLFTSVQWVSILFLISFLWELNWEMKVSGISLALTSVYFGSNFLIIIAVMSQISIMILRMNKKYFFNYSWVYTLLKNCSHWSDSITTSISGRKSLQRKELDALADSLFIST